MNMPPFLVDHIHIFLGSQLLPEEREGERMKMMMMEMERGEG